MRSFDIVQIYCALALLKLRFPASDIFVGREFCVEANRIVRDGSCLPWEYRIGSETAPFSTLGGKFIVVVVTSAIFVYLQLTCTGVMKYVVVVATAVE